MDRLTDSNAATLSYFCAHGLTIFVARFLFISMAVYPDCAFFGLYCLPVQTMAEGVRPRWGRQANKCRGYVEYSNTPPKITLGNESKCLAGIW